MSPIAAIDWYHMILAASNQLLLVFFISVALSFWTRFKNLQNIRVQRGTARCFVNCMLGTLTQLSLLSWQKQDGKWSSYLILLVVLSLSEYGMSQPRQNQKP
jgi:hypothetical protein